MACGWEAEDCVIEHWSKLPGFHREPATWRAKCPLCDAERAPLSIWIKGKSIGWRNHCECSKDEVRVRLSGLLPGCVSARYVARHAVDGDDLIKLADSGMPPQSLRLAMYELAGLGTQAALDRMGIRRENRARVIAGKRL